MVYLLSLGRVKYIFCIQIHTTILHINTVSAVCTEQTTQSICKRHHFGVILQSQLQLRCCNILLPISVVPWTVVPFHDWLSSVFIPRVGHLQQRTSRARMARPHRFHFLPFVQRLPPSLSPPLRFLIHGEHRNSQCHPNALSDSPLLSSYEPGIPLVSGMLHFNKEALRTSFNVFLHQPSNLFPW